MTDDAAVLAALRQADVRGFDDVIALMLRIESLCDDDDGLKWFIYLYRSVTEELRSEWYAGLALSPAWLETLVVEFWRLCQSAVERSIADPRRTPAAWEPLLANRRVRGIARVQFMLAGLNAHINRDLFLAVIAACAAHRRGLSTESDEYRDYERVNDVLDRVEVRIVREAATGPIRKVSEVLSPHDHAIAMYCVSRARRVAWYTAKLYVACSGNEGIQAQILAAVDRATGSFGRLLVIPTET